MNIFSSFFRKSTLVFSLILLAKIGFSQPIPTCPPNTPPADDCADACYFGQGTLNTMSSSSMGYTGSGILQYCGSIENDQWVIVQAASVTGEVTVFPSNCENGNGLQVAIYEECGGPFLQCNVGAMGNNTNPISITVSLQPGQFYYLLVDGFAGDICDFTINTTGFTDSIDIGLDTFTVIKGRVALDELQNCVNDSTETSLHHWLIEQTGNPPHFSTTNANGEYRIFTDEFGAHDLILHKPIYGDLFWESCADTIPIVVTAQTDTIGADFQIKKLVNCQQAFNNVQLNTVGNRPCFPTILHVSISNYGNLTDTIVECSVILDPLLTLDSTEIPIFSQNGDTLNFLFGPILFGYYNAFKIYTHLPCDTSVVGQTFCNELLVYNEPSCDTIFGWSGASLKVAANCNQQTGKVDFSIKNSGNAATSTELPYIIIEDEVVLMQGLLPAGFAPGQIMPLFAPATGKTLRLEIAQEQNHPGFDRPSVVVEGCNGPVSPGFVNQFAPNDAAPSIDIDCRTITLSYDPNIKSAIPVGYLPEFNYIRRGDDLEYTIDFQNTGTDTAFSVVITDDISPNLDLATIRFASASHPFDWEIYGTGTLRVWFPGIKLVDSLTNEAASKGFVQFRISQKPNLPLLTQIFNKAAIYFDINSPIITNKTMHTIGEDLLFVAIVKTTETSDNSLKINVLPNPFSEKTTISISPAPVGLKTLRVFAPDGKTWRTTTFDGENVELLRAGLPDAMLFFTIEMDGKQLAAGKIIAR